MKIIHCADLHLDSNMTSNLSREQAKQRKAELLATFERMWDRLVQQCIKQIMEPVCEAKFSENSYGFRPLRSVEHAIQRIYQLMQEMFFCLQLITIQI